MVIAIDGVRWTYPHADAPSLNALDLHIARGEFVIVCGASGSGKSTALRLMNGLVPQFHDDGVLEGQVRVSGLDTVDEPLDAIGLVTGTVLQHPRRQFFTDNATDELAFAMENFGFERERIIERVSAERTALAVGVPIEQRLSELSGGQQQQVAIAASTAHEPAILLLDEPSSNLSADAVARLVTVLSDLKARGVTVVIAEHRLRYLQSLADRVIVMGGGRIEREWDAQAFRAAPDEELASLGLRGAIRRAVLPDTSAHGASIARPVPARAPVPARVPEPELEPGSHDEPASKGLQIRNLTCRLGGRPVLDIAWAKFPAGEVTAIRGVNGAGKSTLARVVCGLQRSRGDVILDGRVLSRRARLRASAIVMQDVQRQLFTDSVRAEIDLAVTDAPGVPNVDDVLERLDLAHLAERHPLSLSGGQQQRLVVATVRVAGRRIVVFDEPSSGVDRRHLQSIADQIREVAALGAVVLLISHDEDLLALAADRQLELTPLGDPARERDGRRGDPA